MDKVFVKVDYQVLAGGAIRPTRIHWHDGRIWNIDKTLHACTSECDFKGIRYTVLIGSAENIYIELMTSGMWSQFTRRWTQVEKLHFIR